MTERTPPTGHLTRRQFVGGLAGVGTIPVAGCLGNDDDEDDEQEENGATDEEGFIHEGLVIGDRELHPTFPMELVQPGTEDVIANVHWHGSGTGEWHRMPMEVPESGVRVAQANFVLRSGEFVSLGADQEYDVEVFRTEETPADLLETHRTDNIFEFRGQSRGEGELVFELLHEGDRIWLTPPLWTEVLPENELDF